MNLKKLKLGNQSFPKLGRLIAAPMLLTLLFQGVVSIAFTQIQSNVEPVALTERWELAPTIVVCPNETLTILTTIPIPAFVTTSRDGGNVLAKYPLWEALGGHIASADDNGIVYQAPSTEGVYLVYWKGTAPAQSFGFFVKVKSGGDGALELPEAEFEGQHGVFIPLARAERAPVRLFLLSRAASGRPDYPDYNNQCGFTDNQGNYKVDPPNTPFFPNKRPLCSQGICSEVRSETVQVRGFTRDLGEIKLSGQIAVDLRSLGIEFTAGITVRVLADITRTMYITQIDCYKCENGTCKYDGSRVEYLVCETVNGYSAPAWMCEAIDRWKERYPQKRPLFPEFPPCGTRMVERKCVSGGVGNCQCPPKGQPVFTRGCN